MAIGSGGLASLARTGVGTVPSFRGRAPTADRRPNQLPRVPMTLMIATGGPGAPHMALGWTWEVGAQLPKWAKEGPAGGTVGQLRHGDAGQGRAWNLLQQALVVELM